MLSEAMPAFNMRCMVPMPQSIRYERPSTMSRVEGSERSRRKGGPPAVPRNRISVRSGAPTEELVWAFAGAIKTTAAAVATAKSRNLRHDTLDHGCRRIRRSLSIIRLTPSRPSFLQRDFDAPVQCSAICGHIVSDWPRCTESLRHQLVYVHAMLLQPRHHRFRSRLGKCLVMRGISLVVRVPGDYPMRPGMVVD